MHSAGFNYPTDISLNYLLSHSSYLWPLKRFVGASQTPLVKALRQYAPEVFELQLIVAAPQPWFNRAGAASSSTPTGAGGYEIRRTDPSPSALTKKDWDERTVYIVRTMCLLTSERLLKAV
jgi:hypothetical protein